MLTSVLLAAPPFALSSATLSILLVAPPFVLGGEGLPMTTILLVAPPFRF